MPGISFSVFGWPLYCLKIYKGITRGKRLEYGYKKPTFQGTPTTNDLTELLKKSVREDTEILAAMRRDLDARQK